MAAGLVLHGIANARLNDPGVTGIASPLARLAASASASWWEHWYLSVPIAAVAYLALERRVAGLPLYLRHELVRLATVLWLAAILALWYPWHRVCNCMDYLSETDATVATLPALAVVLFALGVWTQRRA